MYLLHQKSTLRADRTVASLPTVWAPLYPTALRLHSFGVRSGQKTCVDCGHDQLHCQKSGLFSLVGCEETIKSTI